MKKNIKKHILKFLSAFTALCICASLLGGICAFAAEDDEISISINSIRKDEVEVGDVFKLNIDLDFSDAVVARAGVFMLRAVIKFDSNLLIPVDPETSEEIVTDEEGAATDGSFFTLGEIVTDDSMTARLSSDGNKLTFVYGGEKSNDIATPGTMATIAFRVNPDMAIEGSESLAVSVSESSATGRDFKYDESGNVTGADVFTYNTTNEKWIGSALPKFKILKISAKQQNDILTVYGTTSLPEDAELMATIINANKNVIEETAVTIGANGGCTAEFTLSEETYAVGNYYAVFTYGNTSTSRIFTVNAKAEDPPAPEEPGTDDNAGDDNTGDDAADDDNTSDDNTDDDNTDSDSTSDDKDDNSGSNNRPGNTPTTLPGTVASDTKDENKEEADDTDAVVPADKPAYPTDIAGHWAEENVKYVYDNGLMTGYEDGTFGAENNITRAEFATVMARLLGLEQNADAAAFEDCAGHWAKGYIGALANAGIVGGVSDTEFAPDANITREQMAVILSRAFSLEEPFDSMAVFMDDEQISDWAYSDVYKVLNAGYMKGDDSGCFSPLANATRAEVATVIYRLHSQM